MKKKIGAYVRFTAYLDNDQHAKYEEFKKWLTQDRLDKENTSTVSTDFRKDQAPTK